MVYQSSSSLLPGLGDVLRGFLSPLEDERTERWLRRSVEPLKSHLGADRVNVLSGSRDGASPRSLYGDLDDDVLELYLSRYSGLDFQRAGMMETGLEVGHPWMFRTPEEVQRSRFYREFLLPNQMETVLAMMAHGPAGRWHAMAFFYPRRLEQAQLSERTWALQAVLPAFEAGLQMHGQWREHRTLLGGALDSASEGLQISDLDGRVLHRNAALEKLLLPGPDGDLLAGAIERTVAAHRAAAARVGASHGGGLGERVHTSQGRFSVRATRAPEGMFGPRPVLLVQVSRPGPRPLSDAELRERFGLTRKEVAVARLVAEGLSNAEIARRLVLSPLTARNHVAHVLAKLQVPNRARVASTLLRRDS